MVSVDKDNETLDLSIRTDHLKEPRSTAVVLVRIYALISDSDIFNGLYR